MYKRQTLIDELAYTNLNQRGYLTVTFDQAQMQANWIFVDTIKSEEYKVDASRGHQLTLDVNLNVKTDSAQVA